MKNRGEMMAERRYTLAEIDALRSIVRHRVSSAGIGIPYNTADRDAEVEDQLRTLLAAGISLEDAQAEYDREYVERIKRTAS